MGCDMTTANGSDPEAAWPTQRSRRSSILAQFGQARTDLVGWSLVTGDPLADAVVDELHELGRSVRVALANGISNGLGTLDDPPPAVAALLRQAETLPDYVDDELLETGSLPYFSSPLAAGVISLSAGALVRVYDSPSIAKVLAMTGRLVDGADRRIRETGGWVNAAMTPGSLRRGQPGYRATLQVRMLHAHMRRLARTRGYDEAAYGAPINQVDLARTWMDFTLTSLRAEAVMGFDRTSAERASLYRYWWYIGHLLGLDARLVEGISSNEDAARVDEMLQAVTGPPIPESADLALASLKSIAATLHELLSLPEGVGLPVLFALTRRIHGHAVGDELRLPRAAAADALLGPAIQLVRSRHAKIMRDQEALLREQTKGITRARALIAERTEATHYEHQSDPAAAGH